MSPHSMERSARISSSWLWIVLAICLIGWRVASRVEQYHPSVACAGQQCKIAFFDSNERNIAGISASQTQSRLIASEQDRLFPVVEVTPTVAPSYRVERDARIVFPLLIVDTVTLFSNPPPSLSRV